MEEDEDNGVVRYHRRLDRTPEKEFERLPETEKKLLSTMRGALENCRNKVDRLKDDLTDRETMIKEERTRRKEAEERLRAYLVDPYATPQINSELRRRLPRANKRDPLLDKEEDLSTDEALEEHLKSSVLKKTSADVSSSRGRSESKKLKKKTRRSLNSQSRPTLHNTASGQDFADVEADEDVSSSGDERPTLKHSSHGDREKSRPRQLPNRPAYYPPPYYPYSTGIGYPPGIYGAPYHRPLPLTPWSSASSLNMFPAGLSPRQSVQGPQVFRIPQSASLPSLNNLGAEGGTQSGLAGVKERIQSSSMTALLAVKPDTDATTKPLEVSSEPAYTSMPPEDRDKEAETAPNNSANPQMSASSNLQSHSATSVSSHYALPSPLSALGAGVGQRYPLSPMSSYPLYPLGSLEVVGSPGELTAHSVSLLHEEIGRLKEANKQLSDKLRLSGQELEALKLQISAENPADSTLDGPAAKKLAEFMEEIQAAQKKRDRAVEARLRQANEDRDEALCSLTHARENHSATKERNNGAEDEPRRDRDKGMLDPPYRKAARYERSRKHLDMSDSSSDFDTEDEETLIREKIAKTGQREQNLRVDSMDDSGSDFDRRRGTLLREIEHRQQREREIYQEELQIIIEQRDQAVEQLRREREKQQMQQIRMPGQREQMLMAKIAALQREKDKAVEVVRQLREEQYDMSLLSSLHKALFPDSAVNDVTTSYIPDSKLGRKTPDREEVGKPSVKEDNQLLEQLRQVSQQNSLLMKKCEELEAACARDKEEKNKLERLNGVLRKKCMTISSGTGQMEEE